MNYLSPALTVLSAMITPVVLILASGQLILTTSQRLSRVVERTRKLMEWIKELMKTNPSETSIENEVAVLFEQLHKNTRRARLLTRSMSVLYITLSIFVATSISIGVVDISKAKYTWIPLGLGILGAGLLFYASVLLIRESRIALSAVNAEMDSAIRFVHNKYPDMKKS
jgi:threonine/homoserine/homoserine lactone efflux protein